MFLAYAAGFVDGEGCFQFRGGTTPDVRITNTYPWILFMLAAAFGGQVALRKSPHYKTARSQWEWYVSGQRALRVCRTLAPLLVEKRRQAELLLSIPQYPKQSALRRSLIAELKTLKRVEYA